MFPEEKFIHNIAKPVSENSWVTLLWTGFGCLATDTCAVGTVCRCETSSSVVFLLSQVIVFCKHDRGGTL